MMKSNTCSRDNMNYSINKYLKQIISGFLMKTFAGYLS